MGSAYPYVHIVYAGQNEAQSYAPCMGHSVTKRDLYIDQYMYIKLFRV